jgi:hypothetical protein
MILKNMQVIESLSVAPLSEEAISKYMQEFYGKVVRTILFLVLK